jgi:hypothetical protein
MNRPACFVAILLVLSTAAPVMACVTGSAMSHEEKVCCRSMHGNCPEMAKMGCCRTKVRTDDHPQLVTSAPVSIVQCAAMVSHTSNQVTVQSITLFPSRIPEEHSPPESPAANITILRI